MRAENLSDDEELERFFLWIEGRKGKDGSFKDDATKNKAEEIVSIKYCLFAYFFPNFDLQFYSNSCLYYFDYRFN